MTPEELATDCDRVVREALAEPHRGKAVVKLLQWIKEHAEAGDLEADTTVKAMLQIGVDQK